jgi:hypothetical protein
MPSHLPAREDAIVEPGGELLARLLSESDGSWGISTIVSDPKRMVLFAENTNYKKNFGWWAQE